jgi:hypothetical protein
MQLEVTKADVLLDAGDSLFTQSGWLLIPRSEGRRIAFSRLSAFLRA